MALVVDDRIKETTATTGTSTYTLGGAVTGFQDFSAIGNGNTTYYCCTDGTDFEVGIGTFTLTGTTLARTTILESTNSGAAVNWGAGDKDIFCTLPASKAVFEDASNNVAIAGDVTWGDNDKAIFGAGSDLEIYHDGLNSYVSDEGTGKLILRGSNAVELQNAFGERYLYGGANAATTIYYDNAPKLSTSNTGVDVAGNITLSGTADGRDLATDGSKLDGIEASADVTDTASVTAAGALMDSEVTNLAQVKAFDSSDYATAAQGTTADAALPKAGGTMTGALNLGDNVKAQLGASNDLQIYHDGSDSYIKESGTGNLIIDSNGSFFNLQYGGVTKLAVTSTGISAIGNIAVTGTVDGRDVATDGTKLDGIESGADVTDATNVTAAGALMDSELTSEASVKAIDQGLSTTDTPTFAGLTSNGDIVFEGATADDFETTLTVSDPTADQTITLPDQTGTAMLWQSPWPDDLGADNIPIGGNTLTSNTSGTNNIAIGVDSLNSLTNGSRNTAVGYQALYSQTTNNGNTGIGDRASYSLTTGTGNVSVGSTALYNLTTGSSNTSIGNGAGGGSNTTYGTYVGNSAGNFNTIGKDYQTIIGSFCGNDCYGDQTTAVGAFAMTDGNHFRSTAVGYAALGRSSTSSAIYNVAIGWSALSAMYSGDYLTAIGMQATTINTSDRESVVIGSLGKAASYSVVIGHRAGYSASGSNQNNVVIGKDAGYDLDGGSYCTFVGFASGYAGGTADSNVGVGTRTLWSLTSGGGNTALGSNAFRQVSSGSSNTAIGDQTGFNLTTGNNNVFLGAKAGYFQDSSSTNGLTTGTNVMCLGFESVPSSATATNEITLGDNDIATLRCNVQTISSLSDQRDKTAIEDLPYGLEFINDMRPVQFTWNRRDGSLGAKPDIGFIAQELNDVELDHSSSSRTRLVNWANPEKLEADYVRSYPILVKAVQELSAKCDALEARIATLEGN